MVGDGRGGVAGGVAVVTGGAGGIGQALAAEAAAGGARVAVVDRDGHAAREVAASLPGAIGLAADVGVEADVVAMVQAVEAELGPVDLYFSNAGIIGERGLGSNESWAATWAADGMAHVYAARAVLPGMAARGSGAMVITASAAGLLSMMQAAPYTVTKHASVAIAEWLAIEYGDSGVSLHCVAPQGVRTPMVTSDPQGEAEVAASGAILAPAVVAQAVFDAIESGQFLVLPHPEVHDYEVGKVADRDRWLAGMRRLRARMADGPARRPGGGPP